MNKFWAGWLVAIAINSLVQDLIGKEVYLALVMSYWWTSWITIPLSIFLIYMAYKLYHTK